jgi:hypothetical protein
MMKTLSRAFNYFYIVLVSIFLILVLFDTVHVAVDSTDYTFSSEGTRFERRLSNYLGGNFLIIFLLGLFLYVGIKKIRIENNKIWDVLYVISTLFFFGIIIYGYIQWYLIGFDHV